MDSKPLDVITRLAEHQQNLPQLGRARARVALVALPLPPLCAGLGLQDFFDRRRARELERLASALGGGDGPAPILDLERDRRPPVALLAELDTLGVEEIVVHGARDQPGFARAIALHEINEDKLRIRHVD